MKRTDLRSRIRAFATGAISVTGRINYAHPGNARGRPNAAPLVTAAIRPPYVRLDTCRLRFKNTFRYGLLAALLLSVASINSCVQYELAPGNQEPTVPKVQTLQELLGKLKLGMDQGMLGSRQFYAGELGYVVEELPDPKDEAVFDVPRQFGVPMTEGEFAGETIVVSSWRLPNRRKAVTLKFAARKCMKIERIRNVFAPYFVNEIPDSAFHRHVLFVPAFYEAARIHGAAENAVHFTVDGEDGCLLAVTSRVLYK